MMQKYVILDANDLVQVGGAGIAPDGSLKVVRITDPQTQILLPGEIGITADVDAAALARMMRVAGLLVARPVSPQPTVDAGVITVPPCPLGTLIYVYDLLGAELMVQIIADTEGFSEVIDFTGTGQFEVEVHAPLPHLFTRLKVTL